MRINFKHMNWLKAIVISLSLLIMSACSTTGNNKGPDMTSSDMLTKNNANQAKTYAMKSQAKYKVDNTGKRINILKAPNNQSFYFAFDASSMRPQDLNALNIQANYLVAHPNAKIRLEGNTDDRGSREYNIGLGWRRDQSVAQFLEQQGVKPSQIAEVSYGKERPVALGDNQRSWSMNRRVDLVYTAN